MWPLAGVETVGACGGECSFAGLAQLKVWGAVTDSRTVSPGDLFVAVKGERFDGHDFVSDCLARGAVLALVSRAWFSSAASAALGADARARCVVVDDVIDAFRALAASLRTRFNFPVYGIGGSNGKTTTKEMLAALLGGGNGGGGAGPMDGLVTKTEKSFNGYLGVAITLCARAHAASRPPRALVLEIGIDEPGAMERHLAVAAPDVVLLTALGPEHLAGLGTWERAVEEEYLMFSRSPRARRVWQLEEPMLESRLADARDGDVLVASRARRDALGGRVGANVDWLTFEVAVEGATETTLVVSWEPGIGSTREPSWTRAFNVALPGLHNARNFALACGAACAHGVGPDALARGWAGFRPPEMRSRIVPLRSGGVLFDDCYNASPSSVAAALDALGSPEWRDRAKVVVLGDMLDLGEESKKWHLDLLPKIGELKNTHLCLYGAAMYDVFKALETQKGIASRWEGRLCYLDAGTDPRAFLDGFPPDAGEAVILVKGSRGMDLGRVVDAVGRRYGAA